MTDPYAWFDPHEERERRDIAETRLRGVHFQIADARQRGQEDILQKIVEGEKSYFWRTVKDVLGYIGERVAEEAVFPRMRANFDAAKAEQRRLENEFRVLNLQILTPMMSAPSPIGLQAYMAPANERGDTGPRIVFDMPAFRFTQQLPPTRDLL